MAEETKKVREWTSIVFQKKSIPKLLDVLNKLRAKEMQRSNLYIPLNRFLEENVANILEKELGKGE